MTMLENMWASLNCSTIASTSYKNRLRYAGYPLTELINENELSLVKNLSIVQFILFLTIPAVSVPGLILRIAKFIGERKWYHSHIDLIKNDTI